MDIESKCPVMHGANTQNKGEGTTNRDWWPNQLDISILHQHDKKSNPMGEDFDYRDEYNEMFGWRSLRYNQIRGDAAIRDYGGQIVETLEFRPDMSTSIE